MSAKPKVLHVHFWADIRNSAGSVEKVITAFAAHGIRYDHCIACYAGSQNTPRASIIHHGIDVHYFRENLLLNRLMNKMLRLGVFTYPDLVQLIDRLRPAILHIHNRQEVVDALVGRLSYLPRVVVHYHRHFERPSIPRSADLLVFVSAATAADIVGKTGTTKPYRIVGNPISMELIEHLGRVTKTDRIGGMPTILFGGGNSALKGGRELLDAFLALPSGTARLVLAGRGVESFAVDNSMVEILGEIPADEFFAKIQQSDIIAMPSYDEPFGLIAQEAMLMGRLLVTTATGGLAGFVDDKCAIVVRPRDVASLRDGLRRALALLDRPNEVAQLLSRARAQIAAFAPETVAATLEAAYDSVLGAD